MATIRKKRDKWAVSIRRSFHKPLFKSFASKQDDENIGGLAYLLNTNK